MPKHRRRKNQRKNKGNKSDGGGSNKGNKQEQRHQTPGGAELGKAANEIPTGTSPEIETVDDIRAERTQTIELRSPSAGCGGDESKIADDKSDAGDSGKTLLESEQSQSNFANFSDTCGVTESLENASEDHHSKTGAQSSTERKAGEPSQPVVRELVEIRKNDHGKNEESELRTSPTSSSLSSSDSDTIKAEDSPEREVPNVVEFESHDMHDVTKEKASKDICTGESVREIDENVAAGGCGSVEESKSASSISSSEGFDDPYTSKKPVKHQIVQEVITTLYPYRVESPKPMQTKTVKSSAIKKSRSLDDDDLMIQEMSDNSSAGDLTDNQPLVSEAESEADSSDALEVDKADPRILSITTIPLDSPEANSILSQEFASSKKPEVSSEEGQDFKTRRAKKRSALEVHFMPQFINPRYLDSIKEECSDMSDAEKKSISGDLSLSNSPSGRDPDDDVFPESPTIAKKANAIFPKSNLDFSHRHKPVSHLRPPKSAVIREEPPCVVVEAKIVEQESIEESCSTWTTDKVQESGAAEIVYLDSASSSSSDLMDLDYTQGNDADVEDLTEDTDVHIMTPTIELDGEGIFNDSSAHISDDQQNRLPLEQREENFPSPPPVVSENPLNSEVIEKPPESCDHRQFYEQSASDGHVAPENSSENNSAEVVDHSVDFESSTSECSQVTAAFRIGEPCSATMFASLLSPLISDKENVNKLDSVGSDAAAGVKELSRQDSSGSHGSGQSQSTVHSQCTAINKDSLTHSDVADFADVGSCVSGSFHEDTAIQTLRQLCIEVLASMPYGKEVLEELASVAQSLNHLTQQHQENKLSEEIPEMPYPLPDLPHIKDLEVPISGNNPTKVKLVAVPPTKPESPIPPPVPELPKEDSWLGVPTKKDPNLLVCLSPSQRNYLKETNTFPPRSADSLLDMHQKFVERRGYHELTTDQVNAVHHKKAEHVVSSTAQLRNSVTPPPVPPPPLPQVFTQSEPVATSSGDGDDRNNHRLLAIIRNSKQSSSENSPRKIEQEAQRASVSVSRAQCSDQETQTAKGEDTTTPALATSSGKEHKLSEDSGQGKSDSSMAQANFDRENFFKTWASEDPIQTDFKRFSNIETTPKYCGQIMQTMPKRYSNIETSSYESRKRVENGHVVYDFCDSKQEKISDQDKGSFANSKSEIMSDAKLDRFFGSSAASPAGQNFEATQGGKNSYTNNEKKSSTTSDFSYDEFRQRAKETAKNAKNEFFKREHLLKDFEDIEKILTDDMFTMGKGEEIKRESKADMWADLEKKILNQEPQKEVKLEKTHYENVAFPNKPKTPNDSGKSRQVFQQEHKEHKKETRSYEIPIRIENKKTDAFEELDKKMRQTERQHSFEIPRQGDKTTDPWDRFDKLKRQYSLQNDQQQKTKPETHEIPIRIEDNFNRWEKSDNKMKQEKSEHKVINIPVQLDKSTESNQSQKSNERVIPVKVEEKQRPASTTFFDQYSSTNSSLFKEHKFTEKRLSSHNLDEWMKYADLGASSDNITKPFMKEMEIVCHGKRANIRAPRLSASTSNLHTIGGSLHSPKSPKSPPQRPRYNSYNSAVDQTPITQYVTPHYVRQCSLPRDLHNNQAEYIKQKEHELQAEFDKLEHDRRRLIEEMDRMHTSHQLRKDLYQHRSCRLPTLSEEEAFRQQMHDEWMSKVAEREERRLHKIIKISKPTDVPTPGAPEKPVRKSSSSIDISDEFLKRVKERRSKLQMPSDSDWDSGAESHPPPRPAEPVEEPSVKVIEGQQEADIRRLPKHLREFAELTSKIQEEHSEESATYKTTSTMSKKDGVWAPGLKSEDIKITKESSTEKRSSSGPIQSSPTPPPPPPPPLWSPEPSPTPGRKEFRPIKFESPVLQRRYVRTESTPVDPPWSYNNTQPFLGYQSSSCSNINSVGTGKRSYSSTSDIPQKVTDNTQGKGATYTEPERPKIPKDNSPGILRPNEVIFSVKHEYMSEPETENDRPKKMAQLGRRQFEGIGPTTRDGMPIVLRSEVKENNQHQWYKRMYNTLHKAKEGGRYPYKSNGYMSEPEPNYDSDYSAMKYSTLDRRRAPSTGTFHDERNYGTMPNPVKAGSGSYKNQPGRIENYVPGRSSVSDKEKKEWWDEVMDIFNGHLEQQKLSSNYTEGYLSRALKEQGYESDSNLVFRKREEAHLAPLSPVEQKQAYRSVQAGGEPPLQGFRKAAPEKPKENDVVPPSPPTKGVPLYQNGHSQESPHRYFETDVNIHYKTPIRYEYKEAIPEEELARKQAETMKKLYQEERRRKYLQELQDMNSRRHTDNFTPTQKSPISLNRYDDFNANISPKSPGSVTYPRTVARALYNFQGQTARELTFKKGDVIYIRRQIDKNWFEGEHNAMIGLLPANYVEVISKDGVRQPPKKPSEGQARAKFNFQAQSAIELSLNKGELVTLTRRVDENWFEGKIANRKGIFPVSYVEVLTDIGAEEYSPTHIKPVGSPASHSLITHPNTQSLDTLRTNLNNEFNSITGGLPANGVLRETKSTHKTEVLHVDTNSEPIAYRALYKYRPQNNDELELQEGDIVYVLEKCDDGWYVGTSQRTGYFGTFPGNYVERL